MSRRWYGLILALSIVIGQIDAAVSSQLFIHEQKATEYPVATLGYTHQQPDGNRLGSGRGALPDLHPLDIPLVGQPHWLVGVPIGEGSLWAVVLADGRVQAFRVIGERVEPVSITPAQLPPSTPPLLAIDKAGLPILITPPTTDASPITHPVMLPTSKSRLVFIETNGDLVIWEDAEIARLPVNALPDARLLVDERARVLLLTEPTGRYGHGVLGDAMEAASITLVETVPTPGIARKIGFPDPVVVEGIAPIWTDLTGDGIREIIVTLSDADQGARLVVFNELGDQIAAGPAIGQGYRWRDQLAVAPFGPDRELEIVAVRTPPHWRRG